MKAFTLYLFFSEPRTLVYAHALTHTPPSLQGTAWQLHMRRTEVGELVLPQPPVSQEYAGLQSSSSSLAPGWVFAVCRWNKGKENIFPETLSKDISLISAAETIIKRERHEADLLWAEWLPGSCKRSRRRGSQWELGRDLGVHLQPRGWALRSQLCSEAVWQAYKHRFWSKARGRPDIFPIFKEL